mgnify:FL=1
MKQSRKDFIKRLFDDAHPIWKVQIKKEFPELFEKEVLVVGRWYKTPSGSIFKYNGNKDFENDPCGYGIGITGRWFGISNGKYGGWTTDVTPATDKEVEQALIKEAKKRGFEEGVKFKCLYNHDYKGRCIPLFCSEGYLWLKGGCVFKDGQWAETVETITKKQAEKELGKTILN